MTKAPGVLIMHVPEPFSRNARGEDFDIMSANISVMGMPQEMGGLTESLAKFRKHGKETGDALMNISGIGTIDGLPKDKDMDRPQVPFQPFPTRLHKPEGTIVAHDASEKAQYLREGYRPEPYVKPQIAVLDPATEKKQLLERNNYLEAQLAKQSDQLARLLERMDVLEKDQATPKSKPFGK